MAKELCLLLAVICFALKGLNVPVARLDLIALGLAFVTLSFIV